MNLGDDISNLLRNLGKDAGVYQDLSQYNAAQAARRRLPPGSRPVRAAAPDPVAEAAAPAPTSSLTSILQRLADPGETAAPQPAAGNVSSANGTSAVPPPRLDRLFHRLAGPDDSPGR
jgi:hypothetical protein